MFHIASLIKRFHYKAVLTLPALFFLASCVKEITIETDSMEQHPVVNCIFSPDSVFKATVSLTGDLSEGNVRYIENATVSITGGDEVITLDYTGKDGIYVSSQKPEIDVPYEIKVNIQGYETLTAKDKIPNTVQIEKAVYFFGEEILNDEKTSMVKITFTDDFRNDNYYDCIDFKKEGTQIVYNMNYHGQFTPDNLLINEGYLDYYPTSFFFSDQLINGQTYILALPFATNPYIYNNIELRTTSRNYYLYRKFWTRHLYSQGNDQNIGSSLGDLNYMELLFSGEPIEMYTNVENGYGIFAGYSADAWYAEDNVNKKNK